jgi:hypothetical protein
VIYSGNASAAVISTTNASALTLNVIGTSSSDTVLGGAAVSGQNELARGRLEATRRLSRGVRDTARRPIAGAGLASGAQVDETIPCDGSIGTSRTFGTINADGTATLTIVYNNCLIGGDTFDGQVAFRVDAYDFGYGLFADSTISFTRLSVRGPGLSLDGTGSIRTQVSVPAETVTENLVTLDNLTGRMSRSENVVFLYFFNDYFSPTSAYSVSLTGRIYDHVEGYLDVSTSVPLFFGTLAQQFPQSGQFQLMGSAGARIDVVAQSAQLAQMQLDLDGDAVFELSVTLGWLDIAGVVGADLGDTDGDGMHNGWESRHGLDPTVNDAAQDNDNDGATNLQEYYSGTDPNVAGPVAPPPPPPPR